MSFSQQKCTKDTAFNHLATIGFQDLRIKRALKLYEKNYAIYNIMVLKEIIYRLTIKDNLKKIKNDSKLKTYYSRVNVKQALESMLFHEYYIDLALKQYETENTSIATYNLEEIIEILMKLRSTHPYPIQPDINYISTETDIDTETDTETRTTQTQTQTDTKTLNTINKNNNNKKKTKIIHIVEPQIHMRPDTILSNEEVECKNDLEKLFQNENPLIRKLTIHGDNELNQFDFESESDCETDIHSIANNLDININIALLDAIDKISHNSDINKAKRYSIEKEIISSEKTYYNALKTLLNELIIPMFNNKYIQYKYYSKIVSTIPLMIDFHKILLKELISVFNVKRNNKSNKISLAIVFNQIISKNRQHFINIYVKYIMEYNDILDLFGNTFYKHRLLNNFLKNKRKEKKPLTNFLILPVQRVPRYILLLQNLKKNTNNNHSDYNNIENALNMITKITEKINSEQKRIENISQCLQIQKSLNGLKKPIMGKNSDRHFEGQFIVIKKYGKRQRQFFIFNDILIISNSKYTVKRILHMRTIDIKYDDMNNNNYGMQEFTLITSVIEPIIYIAKSIYELKKIETLIKKNRLMVWDQDLLHLN